MYATIGNWQSKVTAPSSSGQGHEALVRVERPRDIGSNPIGAIKAYKNGQI